MVEVRHRPKIHEGKQVGRHRPEGAKNAFLFVDKTNIYPSHSGIGI
jgi:hypothetical protein